LKRGGLQYYWIKYFLTRIMVTTDQSHLAMLPEDAPNSTPEEDIAPEDPLSSIPEPVEPSIISTAFPFVHETAANAGILDLELVPGALGGERRPTRAGSVAVALGEVEGRDKMVVHDGDTMG
jgi:hypothetical protein